VAPILSTGGANFTSLSVLFFSSDWTTGAAAAADVVTGASVGVGMSSDDAVPSTKVNGTDSTLLGFILAFLAGFFLVISVVLIKLLVGVAMVGLTKILFCFVFGLF
jgi:hypothetical protein